MSGPGLTAEGFHAGETLPEATAGEDAEFNLRHIQPDAVLGRLMKPYLRAMRLASAAGKLWYSDLLQSVFKFSKTSRITGALGQTSSTGRRIRWGVASTI